MMFPGLIALWAVWQQIILQEPPAPIELSIVAFARIDC